MSEPETQDTPDQGSAKVHGDPLLDETGGGGLPGLSSDDVQGTHEDVAEPASDSGDSDSGDSAPTADADAGIGDGDDVVPGAGAVEPPD